jgi:hypothetical protein
MSELYLRREFTATPLGDGTALVLASAGPALRLDAELAGVLTRRREPDSLAGHAAHLARTLNHPPAARGELLARVERLVAQGLLVRWPAPTADDQPAAIRWLGVPTRDRPAALARCLKSHLVHVHEKGRRLDVSVIDSSGPDGAAATRVVVAALAAEFGCRVALVTAEERRAYAGRLAAAAGVPPDVALFALVADERWLDTGCNRNALLLAHVGRAFLGSDDDVVAAPRAAASFDRVALTSAGQPSAVGLFRDEPEALAAVPAWSGSLLDAHERLLGRALGGLLGAASGWEEMGPELSRLAGEGRGDVRVTTTGILGDCGSRYPTFYLWEASTRSQLRALPDEEFRALVESRQVLRAPAAPTVGTGAVLMTTHVAFDHRRTLPPFFPAFRGQDLAFGRLLRGACPDALIAHLPCAIRHVPAVARRASADCLWPVPGRLSFATLLSACLALAGHGLGGAIGEERRLFLLGRTLRELAEGPPEELRAQLHEHLATSLATQVAGWREELEAPGPHSPWRRSLRRFVEESLEGLAALRPMEPVELGELGPAAEAEALRLLRRYGQLLERWPELVAAARTLAAAGRGLIAEEGTDDRH